MLSKVFIRRDDKADSSVLKQIRILRIYKASGDVVKTGDLLFIVTDGETVSDYVSNLDGVVKKVYCNEGDLIDYDEPVLDIAQFDSSTTNINDLADCKPGYSPVEDLTEKVDVLDTEEYNEPRSEINASWTGGFRDYSTRELEKEDYLETDDYTSENEDCTSTTSEAYREYETKTESARLNNDQQKKRATAYALMLAGKLGINVDDIEFGTGPNGWITRDDVLHYAYKHSLVSKDFNDVNFLAFSKQQQKDSKPSSSQVGKKPSSNEQTSFVRKPYDSSRWEVSREIPTYESLNFSQPQPKRSSVGGFGRDFPRSVHSRRDLVVAKQSDIVPHTGRGLQTNFARSANESCSPFASYNNCHHTRSFEDQDSSSASQKERVSLRTIVYNESPSGSSLDGRSLLRSETVNVTEGTKTNDTKAIIDSGFESGGSESWNVTFKLNLTNVVEVCRSMNASLQKNSLQISPLSFIIKALSSTLDIFPTFNATVGQDGKLVPNSNVNVGIAVGFDSRSSFVIESANRSEVRQIAREIDRSTLVRSRQQINAIAKKPTVVIHDLSEFGAVGNVPVIHESHVVTCSVGDIYEEVSAKNGAISSLYFVTFTLVFDRRFADNELVCDFVRTFKQTLSDEVALAAIGNH